MRTNPRHRASAVAAIVVLASLAGCDTSPTTAPRTGSELAAALVEPAGLDGEWAVHEGSDDGSIDGEVTEEARRQLPSVDLCADASDESKAAASDIKWLAFRQLDLVVADTLEPPLDQSGRIVFVQEFLASGTVDDMSATFALLRDGFRACLGDIPAGEEGPGVASEVDISPVGDERYAVLAVIAEAGAGAEWRLHTVLVRDGTTLASVVVAEIRSIDVEAQVDTSVVSGIVTAAVDALA